MASRIFVPHELVGKRQPSGFRMWKSSTTTAFPASRRGPGAARCRLSTSRLKPKVRARAISFWNERPSSSSAQV